MLRYGLAHSHGVSALILASLVPQGKHHDRDWPRSGSVARARSGSVARDGSLRNGPCGLVTCRDAL